MPLEMKDLWQQVSALQDKVQGKLDKIQQIYKLKKRPLCSVSVSQSRDGDPLAIVKISEGDIFALELGKPIMGSPQAVANQILPLLTFLLND